MTSAREDLPEREERDWEVREECFVPQASFEELEIRTSDGAVLRAFVDEPEASSPMRGTLVLAHAMFARKTSFGRRDRPGLSAALVNKGFRTIAFDFRGHGDSKPPSSRKDWSYDDLVRIDIPAVIDCARARSEDKPVLLIGHSLGGHVALASQGTDRVHADGFVLLGANVWMRSLEPSRLRWAAKAACARAMLALSSRTSGVPARRLRLGSDDTSRRYASDLFGGALTNAWRSSTDGEDYLASLANVTVPVACVVGDRDRIMCHPASGEAFARHCTGPVRVFRANANHVQLVTSSGARAVVLEAVEWALARTTRTSTRTQTQT